MKKKQLLIAFIATVLLQLSIPVKMILDSKKTAAEGTEFKFKTVPIDPTDPFRGKYITLSYDITSHTTTDTTFTYDEQVYVLLTKDTDGFAQVKSVLHDPPKDEKDYVTATIMNNFKGIVTFAFPFDRFYMEESKAPEAEIAYDDYSTNKNAKPAYAVIAVLEGNAVVKDVIIEGIPIQQYVEKQMLKK